VRAGVEPRHATAEVDELGLAALDVVVVDVGDLKFAARTGRNFLGDTRNIFVKKINLETDLDFIILGSKPLPIIVR
jgi:hypothetical protein